MADKKEKVVFWADSERTFGDGILFGEEVTGLIDGDRLEKWLDDGTVTEEKPESVAHASQTKLAALTKKCEEQELEIAELKGAAKAPKKPSKAAAKEIAKLEEQVIDRELDVDYLTEMVTEMAKTWEAPKPGAK